MRLQPRNHAVIIATTIILFAASSVAFGQNWGSAQLPRPGTPRSSSPYLQDNMCLSTLAQDRSAPQGSPFANGQTRVQLADNARCAEYRTTAYREEEREAELAYFESQRRREEARAEAIRAAMMEPQAHADPEAPDQSDLLKKSHDRNFILRNFHTMYIDAHEARYFKADQMKAALGRNKEFQKLNIRIVDDPRVADTVLKVSYTFAWDYPFELWHRNTTFVLVSGKGEGPFSGPLGAADVARQFVNTVKEWREVTKARKADALATDQH